MIVSGNYVLVIWPKGQYARAAVARTQWQKWRIALGFWYPLRRVIVARVLESALYVTPSVVAETWEGLLRECGMMR